MATHSVSEVSLALGISNTSVRNWTDQEELQPFLSDSATRVGSYANAKERKYTDEDIFVLNTVNIRKTRSNTWDEVAELLATDFRETDLPASAALVMKQTVADSFADKLIVREQLLAAQRKIEELEDEIRRERDEKKDLYIEIGKLQAKLEILQEQMNATKDT